MNPLETLNEVEKDEEVIRRITKFRKRLSSYFTVDFIISEITKCIDNSDSIDFVNNRSRKFINPNKPVFKLKIDITEDTFENFPNSRLESLIKENKLLDDIDSKEGKEQLALVIDQKLLIIQSLVIDPLLTVLYERLKEYEKENEEIRKEKEEIYHLVPDIKDLDHFFLPSIFKVMVESIKGEIAYIEYVC